MRSMPVALSSSYFTLEPSGISITALNSFGTCSPGLKSCHGLFIVPLHAGFRFKGRIHCNVGRPRMAVEFTSLLRVRTVFLRTSRRQQSAGKRTVHRPPPSYRVPAARAECRRASRPGVREWFRPPSPRSRSRKAPGRRAPRCTAKHPPQDPHERTTSSLAHRSRGQWSCRRCARLRISLFRRFAPRRAFQNASERSRVRTSGPPGSWLKERRATSYLDVGHSERIEGTPRACRGKQARVGG